MDPEDMWTNVVTLQCKEQYRPTELKKEDKDEPDEGMTMHLGKVWERIAPTRRLWGVY